MTHTLPSLDYSVDALEPHVDARTMEIHHGKHHQTYIDKLNGALECHSELNSNSVENLISDLSRIPKIFEVRFVTTEEGITIIPSFGNASRQTVGESHPVNLPRP